jgi:hypothetical protein
LKAAKLRREDADASCAGSAKSNTSRQAGVFRTNALPARNKTQWRAGEKMVGDVKQIKTDDVCKFD